MFIGIIGYRGEDKTKIAKLFGQTLSWMIEHKDEIIEKPNYDFTIQYMKWCEDIDKIITTTGIYYASFSHPLKSAVSLITGIPFTYFNDPSLKHEYIINIDTLEYKKKEGEEKIITPEKLFKNRNRNLSIKYDDKQELPQCTWMTLNDYIIYFGYYICRNYIGRDIWTNVERISTSMNKYNSDIRVYTDVRNKSEYDFIKENDGIIIRLDKKRDIDCEVYDSSLYDLPIDINIESFDDIRSLCDIIYRHCYKIVNEHIII